MKTIEQLKTRIRELGKLAAPHSLGNSPTVSSLLLRLIGEIENVKNTGWASKARLDF